MNKADITIDQYYALFAQVRNSIMTKPEKDLREQLLYHWNNSTISEVKEVVNSMLDKGLLKYPASK